MPPGRLPLEVFRARPTGRRPGADPQHAGGITYLIWPGNTSGSPQRSWKELLGRRTSGLLCWACCHHDPAPDKQKKMDGLLKHGAVSLCCSFYPRIVKGCWGMQTYFHLVTQTCMSISFFLFLSMHTIPSLETVCIAPHPPTACTAHMPAHPHTPRHTLACRQADRQAGRQAIPVSRAKCPVLGKPSGLHASGILVREQENMLLFQRLLACLSSFPR